MTAPTSAIENIAETTKIPLLKKALAAGFTEALLIPLLPHDVVNREHRIDNIRTNDPGKSPGFVNIGTWHRLYGWQNGGIDPAILASSIAAGGNIGLLLGKANAGQCFIALDLDVDDADIATGNAIADILTTALQNHIEKPVWYRTTRPGRRTILLRVNADTDAGKKAVWQLSRNDGATTSVKLEVLCDGQQCAAFGIHGGTHKQITWHRSDEPEEAHDVPVFGDLPFFEDRHAVDCFLRDFAALLEPTDCVLTPDRTHGATGNGNTVKNAEDLAPPSVDDLIGALESMPHDARIRHPEYLSLGFATASCLLSLRELGQITPDQEAEVEDAWVNFAVAWKDPKGTGTSDVAERAKWHNDFLKNTRFEIGWHRIKQVADKALGMELTESEFEAWEELPEGYAAATEDAVTDAHAVETSVKDDTAIPGNGVGEHGPDTIEAVLSKFKEKYAVVSDAGKTFVIFDEYNPATKLRTWRRKTARDFEILYQNWIVKIGVDEDGESIYDQAGRAWLRHRDRPTYAEGVFFDPSGTQMEGMLNIWRGFDTKPKEGDWSLMREHIRTIICDGSEECFEYVMNWIARMLQVPNKPAETAIIMRSGEGTGKGLFMKSLQRIVGRHSRIITNPKHLVGHFNAQLRETIFLGVDEAVITSQDGQDNRLQNLITEETIEIEAKGKDTVEARNYLHVMMASNREWIVPAGKDSRRYIVLDVNESAKGDYEYFDKLVRQMESGGYEAMLFDMLRRDISGFNHRRIPLTAALQQQRLMSLEMKWRWWCDCLMRERIGYSDVSWPTTDAEVKMVPTDTLYQSFSSFAETNAKGARLMSREAFGRFLKKDVKATLRSIPFREDQMRPKAYEFDDLKTCREHFVEATGTSPDWPEDTEDDFEAINDNHRKAA